MPLCSAAIYYTPLPTGRTIGSWSDRVEVKKIYADTVFDSHQEQTYALQDDKSPRNNPMAV